MIGCMKGNETTEMKCSLCGFDSATEDYLEYHIIEGKPICSNCLSMSLLLVEEFKEGKHKKQTFEGICRCCGSKEIVREVQGLNYCDLCIIMGTEILQDNIEGKAITYHKPVKVTIH